MISHFKTKWQYIVIIFFTFFVAFYSPLNPMISKGITTDQAVFFTIAKGILNGKLAYVDYFDHKGIFLYLILALGQKMGLGMVGNYIIEILVIFVSCLFLYKIGRLFAGKCISLLAMMLIFLPDIQLFTTSNSEEYIFPILCISVYLMLLQIKTEIKVSYTCWIGVGGMLVFFIKYNYCLIWAAIGILLFIHMLLQHDKIINILKMILAYMLGMIMAALPFVIYLGATNSFYEFMNSYVLYSVRYAGYTGVHERISSMVFLTDISLKYVFVIAGIVLTLLCIVWIIKKDWRLQLQEKNVICKEYIYWMVLSVAIIVVTASPGQSWIYYRQALMIIFVLPIVMISVWIRTLCGIDRKRLILGQSAYVICLILIMHNSFSFTNFQVDDDARFESAMTIVDIIQDNCKEDDTMISYANDCTMYFYSNVEPASRIFFPGASVVDDNLVDELMSDLMKNKPKIITYTSDWKNGMTDHMISESEKFTNTSYSLIYEDDYRSVYLRNEN